MLRFEGLATAARTIQLGAPSDRGMESFECMWLDQNLSEERRQQGRECSCSGLS